jgi:2-polyprenyl-6-methoxyphenol hydroxylase-like FAD-dependent oxidoreductase
MTRPADHAPSAGSHAIVIGGSMAGLLAARVLTEHFDRVTIIERDRLPIAPEFRSGVPQARHAHLLLVRGRMILEQFFPTLTADLLAAGVPVLDTTADLQFLNPVGWLPRFRSDLSIFSCSRVLLEWTVRQQLARYAGVRFAERCDVIELLPDAHNSGVAGVRVRSRDQANAEQSGTQELHADLVVDASGRSSHTPDWLQALGYPRAQETVINAFLGYASRVYARPSGVSHDWQALWIATRPPALLRGGVIFPMEQDRWMVTLVGAARDYPPTDEAGFLAFARSLASPLLYEAITAAEPLSPIYGYQRTENCLHHYERLGSWPENFVVLGDAVCAFNPVYGQGMTVAAVSALTLDQALRAQRRGAQGDGRGLARQVQRQLAKQNAVPWLMATGEDFRYPATEGGHPDRLTRLTHWYMDRVLLLCAERADVYRTFASVLHMLNPPGVLFRPRILLKVLAYRAQERRALSPAR